MRIKSLSLIYVLLPFSYYYLGPIIFLTYLYSLKSLFSKLWVETFLTFFLVLGVSIILLVKQDILDGLMVIRFFWGWVLFYLFFSGGYSFNLHRLLNILSVLVIGEAFLVNTFISASDMSNYPSPEVEPTHFAQPGEYQRPFSFGGSASVTSASLVSLLAVLQLSLRKSLLPCLAVICCVSGTGFFSLLLYIIYRNFKNHRLFIGLIFVFPLFYLAQSFSIKFSTDYLFYLYELKMNQISTADFFGPVELLFGARLSDVSGMGGDFQLLSFIKLNGFLGIFILFLAVIFNLNRHNWFPIFLMLLGSLHYGLIFYLPGQFIFGYLLTLRGTIADTYFINEKSIRAS